MLLLIKYVHIFELYVILLVLFLFFCAENSNYVKSHETIFFQVLKLSVKQCIKILAMWYVLIYVNYD